MTWYKFGDISPLIELDRKDMVCVDLETTGLNPGFDEILQVAVVRGDREVLLNRLAKPVLKNQKSSCVSAMAKSKSLLCKAPCFRELVGEVESSLAGKLLLIGYNLAFDLAFLSASGVVVPQGMRFDVMREFAPVSNRRSLNGEYRWRSLTDCANHYGVEFHPHDALEDANTTLECFFKMLEDDGQCYGTDGTVPYLKVVSRYREKGRPWGRQRDRNERH